MIRHQGAISNQKLSKGKTIGFYQDWANFIFNQGPSVQPNIKIVTKRKGPSTIQTIQTTRKILKHEFLCKKQNPLEAEHNVSPGEKV